MSMNHPFSRALLGHRHPTDPNPDSERSGVFIPHCMAGWLMLNQLQKDERHKGTRMYRAVGLQGV